MASITVTSAASGAGSTTGITLALRVVNGASYNQNGATATSLVTAVPQLAITPHGNGNWVYGAVVTQSGTAYSSLDANTTAIDNDALSSGSINSGAYRSTSGTTTSSTTYGWAAPTSTNTWISCAEIVANGTLSEDASTPVVANTTSAATITTASFSPPSSSILVACVSANWTGSGAVNIALSDTSGGTYTWTQLIGIGAVENLASIWVGIPPSPSPSDMPKFAPGPTWWAHFKPGLAKLYPPAPRGDQYFGVLPTFTDIPQINPGPTWLDLFKPGLAKPRPSNPYRPPQTDSGNLNITLPTLTASLSGTITHQGSLAITLPTPTASFTGTVINPSDMPSINPGPTWLDIFKPGLAKPRPYIPWIVSHEQGPLNITLPTLITSLSGTITHQGSLNITLPPPFTSLNGVPVHQGPLAITLPVPVLLLFGFDYNRSNIPQINPGPTWLDHFKSGLRKPPPFTSYTISGHIGAFNLTLPVISLALNGIVTNVSDMPQINPGPTWLDIFKPGLAKPRPAQPYRFPQTVTGSLVIILPPGCRNQIESGPLNIFLPTPILNLQGRDQYGNLNIVLPPPLIYNWAGNVQLTESGAFNITLPPVILSLTGRVGRETGAFVVVIPTLTTNLSGAITHVGLLNIAFLNCGMMMMSLSRYEMFGSESLVEVTVVLPPPIMGLEGRVTKPKVGQGEIQGWLRAKRVRSDRRQVMKAARLAAAENKPRRAGEEE